jgi:hypothetical protein
MPKMGVNPEQLKAPKPVPAGWYDLRLTGLSCKQSKSKAGYNYVALFKVVNSQAEFNDTTIFYQMNNGYSQGEAAQDMAHGLGFAMEADGSFPGDWSLKNANKPEEFDGAQYSGVLLGKTANVELAVGSWDGRERNEVKQFKCKIDQCATRFPDIRHKTDLRGKK